ncbi:MAG TPA: T9SS type A sorting domain-containing protein, partial [Chitinophagaceae bacterium]|nr:T9SS type A sorting domain-containing protein [Chitinophagaceae bacterium]
VPVGYASTSDIFVTGAIINSSNGFIKLNGNTNSVVKGMFFSNRSFSDQWAYAIAAYQPQFNYSDIQNPGDVVSVNGAYRAGTAIPIIPYLVQGASGGGGNNYTGSKSSFDNYTACISSESGRIANPEMLITQQENATEEPTKTMLHSGVIVYPNPASNQLTINIQFAERGNTKIELYSIGGTKVLEKNLGLLQKGSGHVITLDLQRLVSGTYLLRVHNGTVITNKKIVINR